MGTVDLAIVGGGLCGTAIGYQCAKLGINVLLIERYTLGGGGATQHSRGIVRLYDPNHALTRWAYEGVDCWRNWEIPCPTPFNGCGVVTLLSEQNVDKARLIILEYHRENYRLILLDRATLVDKCPWLKKASESLCDEFAVFEPDGGYCNPRLAAALYGHAMRELGGTVLEGATVTHIDATRSRVEMSIDGRSVEAKLAVLAAGADAGKLVASLPISTVPIWLSCFQGETRFPASCVIDEAAGTYLRPEPRGYFYCGGADDAGRAIDDPVVAMDVINREHERRCSDLLCGPSSRPVYGIRGADGYTPDHLPLLGFRDDHPTLCLATGFSGRGAKYIPAVAKRLSSEIRDRL